jgi:uncharacterized membrane protein
VEIVGGLEPQLSWRSKLFSAKEKLRKLSTILVHPEAQIRSTNNFAPLVILQYDEHGIDSAPILRDKRSFALIFRTAGAARSDNAFSFWLCAVSVGLSFEFARCERPASCGDSADGLE